MASIMGYGTLLECPYNKSHRVQATAMARHLFKCRRMYPDVKFVTCPFNHAHKIAEPELKMHTAKCEDRANFDMYKYCITTAAATHTAAETAEPELIYNTSDPIAPNKVRDEDDECWDDLRIPAYNPQEYCAKAKIIRKATLKTQAEKKAFYEEEMKRHLQLDGKIKQESPDSGNEDDFVEDRKPSSRGGGSGRSARSGRLSRSPGSRSPSRSRFRSRRSRSPPVPVYGSRRDREYRGGRWISRSRSRSKSRSRSPAGGDRRVKRSHRSRSNSRKSRSVTPPGRHRRTSPPPHDSGSRRQRYRGGASRSRSRSPSPYSRGSQRFRSGRRTPTPPPTSTYYSGPPVTSRYSAIPPPPEMVRERYRPSTPPAVGPAPRRMVPNYPTGYVTYPQYGQSYGGGFGYTRRNEVRHDHDDEEFIYRRDLGA